VPPDSYAQAAALADALEAELKRLNRWGAEPLPPAAFENMGPFGQGTMAFEQWIWFVLLPRLRAIVRERAEFPSPSQLAVYAVRTFDGDTDADQLQNLLYELDRLVERVNSGPATEPGDYPPAPSASAYTPSLGGELPAVVYTLAEVLPQFEGESLESQLQTFDTFLTRLSPAVRPQLSCLLLNAAAATTNSASRGRIEEAARAIARGDPAAEPYDHDDAMKKYREEHRRSFGR
jgi:uncharacterized protein YqcC (DUF446 family)